MNLSQQSQAILNGLADKANAPLLQGILRGVEKEGLRVSPDGFIAQTPHPTQLGSALHHPLITTDYSEALLEFITPPTHTLDSLFECLDDIHHFTHTALGQETLWCNSMPCDLDGDASIPIAYYGDSNRGKMKSVYRMGLGYRYGRVMQTVAGIHYNFSLPLAFWAYLQRKERSTEDLQDFISRRYFDLIRNFRRHYWILIYLFGASPALSDNFVAGRNHDLQALASNPGTLYLPFATSLRMGDLGYQSSAQKGLHVCYNDAQSYVRSLVSAINNPYPPYEAIGLQGPSGEPLQLNTGLLQIENEFYSAIRPKRTAKSGETALSALCRRGVEYIEVRCLDINPLEPNGLSKSQIRFVDAFLLYCLLTPSAPTTLTETQRILQNQKTVVKYGRDPRAQLIQANGAPASLLALASELIDAIRPLATLLDTGTQETLHSLALEEQARKLADPHLTPSSRALDNLVASGRSYTQWSLALSRQHRDFYAASPQAPDKAEFFTETAARSLVLQSKTDSLFQGDFEEYLRHYYAQYPACSRGEI